MRHRKRGRKLGRSSAHRLALKRNLTIALIEHGRIRTTVPKAKEVTPFAHKLITLARKGSLHHRRRAASLLPNKETIHKLFSELAPQFEGRNGGYTRIVRLPQNRLGDNAETCFLELLTDTAPALTRKRGWVRHQRRSRMKFRSDTREKEDSAAPEPEHPAEPTPEPEPELPAEETAPAEPEQAEQPKENENPQE